MDNLYDQMIDDLGIETFEARQSDDAVKRDLELTCCDCGEVICDVEDGDTLGVLVRTALGHVCVSDPDGSMVP